MGYDINAAFEHQADVTLDELRVRVTAAELAHARGSLCRWLLAAGVAEDEVLPIVLAGEEACANAIEHACGHGKGTFELRAELCDGEITLTVSDSGCWRGPRGGTGAGILLMRAFTDDLEVRAGKTGTTVTMRRTLRRADD
jgi:anti-sigma regulatory factor (Ser/Thr protein kinase)